MSRYRMLAATLAAFALVGSAVGDAREDEAIMRDLDFFYYMDAMESEEMLEEHQ